MRIASTGDGSVTISTGNLVIGTAGKGIDFSVNTGGAGKSSQLLDDYEEGAWTPVVKIGTTTNTSVSPKGRYTKIGNVVYIQATITTITKNGTGGLSIEGLPFTVGSSGTFGDIQGTLRWDDIASDGVIYPYFAAGTTNISMQSYSNTGFVRTINDTQISSTYELYGISGFYML